ncbi:MAG: hypothetical protein ACK4GR_01530 [bacterium]
MNDIYELIEYLSSKLEKENLEFLDFKYNIESKSYKIKLIRKNLETKKDIKMQKTEEKTSFFKENEISQINNKSIIYKESEYSRESEDLGGFKIKFINEKDFYIFSTLVGTLKLNEEIEKGKIINPREKIGEIEILNVKNPISLDFKYKILEILTPNKEKLDYGKNIILGEKVEDGSNY